MVVYLDDIPIYFVDLDTHDQYVLLVLSTLQEHGLYGKYEKRAFK